MEDVQRFLRYVMPGLVFFIEICLLLLCSFPQKVDCVIKSVPLNEGIGVFLTVFIISGGIGFFFSVIHHILFNCKCCFFKGYGVNHYGMLNRDIGWNHISLREYGGDWNRTIPATALTKRGTWRIFSSLWHGSGLIPKSAIQHQERLSSTMNGVGTSFVSSIIASLLWFVIHLISFKSLNGWGLLRGLSLSVFFILIFWLDFRRLLEHTQGFDEIVLATKIDEYHWENNREAMKIFVFNRDLKD